MSAMVKEVDVAAALTKQQPEPIFSWLEQNIWSKASTLETNELVKQATGEVLNPEHFKRHLMKRYL